MKKLFDVLSNEEFGIFESRESPFLEYLQIKGVFIFYNVWFITTIPLFTYCIFIHRFIYLIKS